jgi:hypothetical protein
MQTIYYEDYQEYLDALFYFAYFRLVEDDYSELFTAIR